MKNLSLRTVLPALLFSVLVFAFGAQDLQAQITYIVGTCKAGTTFTTIQKALNAVPYPNTVEVCPGTYMEQVFIQNPVTLEGISSNDKDQAIIMPPSGGLIINANDDSGNGVAAQVLVLGVAGANVSNLIIDGTGNNISNTSDLVAGLFYKGSSGTVKGITTQNQKGNLNSVGILLEGDSSDPSVTVEKCSVHDFDVDGIWTESKSTSPELTAVIKGNVVSFPANQKTFVFVSGALQLGSGSMVTVKNNYLNAGNGNGIYLAGAEGEVTGNTISSDGNGVAVAADGAISVKSNNISSNFHSNGAVWYVATTSTEIQDNLIVGAAEGFNFSCNSANGLAHSNTIVDSLFGVVLIPTGTTSANTYLGVEKEETKCPLP